MLVPKENLVINKIIMNNFHYSRTKKYLILFHILSQRRILVKIPVRRLVSKTFYYTSERKVLHILADKTGVNVNIPS